MSIKCTIDSFSTFYSRAGVPFEAQDEILALAKRLASSDHVTLRGLYAHAGHSYNARCPDDALAYLEQECRMARAFRTMFKEHAGVDIPYLSIGATPTVLAILYFRDERVRHALDGISEVHAGVYVGLDRQQVATGLCSYADVSVSVACRVASCYPDRGTVLLDGGALAFSKDSAPQGGYGAVIKDGAEDKLLVKISQEHGILKENTGSMHLGQVVRVVPNHCCLAAACHLFYIIVENGGHTVIDVWIPVRGW